MPSAPAPRKDDVERLRALVLRLAGQLGEDPQILETHISIVLLAGDRAWKFKKPVSLGFLDFSTLDKRRHYCERELALNSRYAPAVYQRVAPISGSADAPVLEGTGPAIEYSVVMRRFDDAARLDRRLESGQLAAGDFAALGRNIGRLYEEADRAPGPHFGTPDVVREQVLETLSPFTVGPQVDALRSGLVEKLDAQAALLEARWRGGWIRDCHGDLHLSNLVRDDGGIHPFDCIEFSDDLRFIDPMSDIAFLLMDLDMRAQPGFANVFLNAYLATIGDYDGLPLLGLYLAYRSLVRAKVAELQRGAADDPELKARAAAHLALAGDYLAPRSPPALVITHGVSGSGKSWLATQLAEYGFVHCRSDVERKRLAGLAADAATGSAPGAGLYEESATAATYARLLEIARAALAGGYSILIDATFLDAAHRRMFREAAEGLGCRFAILDCAAPEAVLRQRVAERSASGGDASEADLAVLERQLAAREPLAPAEQGGAVTAPAGADAGSLAALAVGLGAARPGSPPSR